MDEETKKQLDEQALLGITYLQAVINNDENLTNELFTEYPAEIHEALIQLYLRSTIMLLGSFEAVTNLLEEIRKDILNQGKNS